ncbi:MAG: DNA translocase FtsK 4TM domain-containing protein, partial [Polyangiaceae bacterium]
MNFPPLFAPRRSLANDGGLPLNTRSPSVLGAGAAANPRGREVAALLLWTAAVFLSLALASYEGDPATGIERGANWVGPVGSACAHGLVSLIGLVGWALPLEALLLGIPLVRGRKSLLTPARFAGDLLIVLTAAALVQVAWPARVAFGTFRASGVVGELFGELSRSLFSTIGSFLVGFACLGLILISRATFSFIALMRTLARYSEQGARGTAAGAKSVAEAWKTARDIEREKMEEARLAKQPHIDLAPKKEATIAILPADDDEDDGETLSVADVLVEAEPTPKKRVRKKKVEAPEAPEESPPVLAAKAEPEPEPVVEEPVIEVLPKRAKAPKGPVQPVIQDTLAHTLEKEQLGKGDKLVPAVGAAFRLPPVEFLIAAKVDPTLTVDKEVLLKNAELLVKTLADYGVSGKVEDILPGPTVTTFEVSPSAGTKVSKVASLADDLALALARKVRIVAPIPGKNRIGFELPNERRVPVNLRDLVEDRRFQTFDAPLPVVLGRDILGAPVYADLASMPHVIVAGATGAGKSVGLNVMLTSLLYRKTPEELRFLMIDPKVVELAPFDRIPHMLLPVVTDMKQAANALKWAVDEMERRYQLFADAGTKNITTYNGWVARVVAGEAKNPLPRTVVAKDFNGFEDQVKAEAGEGVQQ